MPVATRRRIITSPLVTRTDVADYGAGLRTVLTEVGLVGTATVTHYGDAVGAESLIEVDGNPRLVTTFRPDLTWAMYGVEHDRITRLIADGSGDHRDALTTLEVLLRLT